MSSKQIVDDKLSLRQRAFVREYLVDRNGTQAAIRAGYSPKSAGESASELLQLSKVSDLLAEKEQRAAAMAEVDAALVISELREVALADPRDLVSLHRGACRYCHGIQHLYEYTPAEYRRAFTEALSDGKLAPEMSGGLAYDFTREPAADCPECRGFGTERVFVKDTRKLSRGAAKLIASIKQSRDGSIELKHRDQDAALLALGKVTGIFIDRSEVSGPGGGPLQLQPVQPHTLSNEQLEDALRRAGRSLPRIIDARLMTGGDQSEQLP